MGNEVTKKDEVKAMAISAESQAMVTMIERIALDPNADIEKLEKMLEMKERIFNKNAELAYNDAMAAAQSEIQSVVRNKENLQQSSKYADLEAVHKQCKPVWTKHGFSVSSSYYSSQKDGHIGVRVEVRHSGGHKETFNNDWPLDNAGIKGNTNKTAIQAIGSTGSYARRYSELMIFDIAMSDDDNDGQTMEKTISIDQVMELAKRLEGHKKIQDKVLSFAGVDALHLIPAAMYDAIVDRLDKTKELNPKEVENGA